MDERHIDKIVRIHEVNWKNDKIKGIIKLFIFNAESLKVCLQIAYNY
jgi:hypothetical protein